MTNKPSPDHLAFVSRLMTEIRTHLERLDLIPRATSAVDSILLALLSKSIVLTESIVLLVSNDFNDEAFGLCRTCVEIELTIRYMTNADTVQRCGRYHRYFAKVQQEWMKLIKRYYPKVELSPRPDAEKLARLAAAYRDPNLWSEPVHRLKYFASEHDSFETREDGSPLDQLFYYEGIYKWMSYYVHAAEPSLSPHHITLPGDPFRVHPGAGVSTRGGDAVRIAYQFVHINLFRILRYFNMAYPSSLMQLYEQALAMQKIADQ